jgi:hypothetical protein
MSSFVSVLLSLFLLYSAAASTLTTLDLSKDWRFSPDPENTGITGTWYREDFPDNTWPILQAGSRWEDQGFVDLDGPAWYRRWVEIPAEWTGTPVWLVFGGINDEYVLYVNGIRIKSFGRPLDHSVANSSTATEVSSHLRFGARNLLALRVVDWVGSGGLQRLPCCLTTDTSQLPSLPPLTTTLNPARHLIRARCDLTTLGNEREGEVVEVSLCSGEGKIIGSGTQTLTMPGQLIGNATFEITDPVVAYTFELTIKVTEKDRIYHQRQPVKWPAKPTWREHPDLEILNNLVTQLADQMISGGEKTKISFFNPREGWVFFSLSSRTQGALTGLCHVFLDDSTGSLVFRSEPETGNLEAMRELPMGTHSLSVSADQPVQVQIRTIPELAYTYYPCTPHLAVQGSFDWDYLEKYVLPHVNTLVTGGGVQDGILDQWWREGRKWIVNSSLPGISGPLPSPESIRDTWINTPLLFDPRVSGIIVDEFIHGSAEQYRTWREAYGLLISDPRFRQKTFYAFSGDLYEMIDPESRAFCQALIDRGDLFAVEKYLSEVPSLKTAEETLLTSLQASLNSWKSSYHDFEKHLIYCLGFLSAPPETLNTNPGLDLKVYMDMQFNLLANDPTCWGLAGIMEYSSSYADEEILRWAHRLYRHYAIEGHKNRLTQDPYLLAHLANPDFDQGTEGWTVQSAGPENVKPGEMDGFSWLQGRYPRTPQGDQFLVLKRSDQAANQISQNISNLQPGRAYSLKLLAADIQHLDQKQDLTLGIETANTERKDNLSFQVTYPSSYSHTLGEYNQEHPAYFTYYRIVFRAQSSTAELVISDWASPRIPGGPIGQEIAINYVEVQPFFEP